MTGPRAAEPAQTPAPAAASHPPVQRSLAARVEALLQAHWWRPQPSLFSQMLRPLSALYGALAGAQRSAYRRGWKRAQAAPVPVVVVGNLIAGGAGKTPTVIALVQALQAAGMRPGIVSRGYGRQGGDAQTALPVLPGSRVVDVGDEPLLMQRRTGVPVWVGRARAAAAQALCAAHPQVDVLVCDDGLQHHALARDAEVWVFDDRGAGNGLLLPAGPLRQTLPSAVPAGVQLLYTGQRVSTPLPGPLARIRADHALPLADWWAGNTAARQALSSLKHRPLLALAGLAAPQKFFDTLAAAGLQITPWPQPDHARYDTLPWFVHIQEGDGADGPGGPDIITTEKDAVKLDPKRLGQARVWVVPLDLELPETLVAGLLAQLAGSAATAAARPPAHAVHSPPPVHPRP